MDLLISIFILLILGLIIAVMLRLSILPKDVTATKFNDKISGKFKYYKFIIRWWLIGKFYCKNTTDDNIIRFYSALNKLFWGIVLIGLCLVFAKIWEGIKWIL